MTIKVGIVGMGNIGNVHGGCYVDDPLAEIVAVCDVIQERADRAAEKYGCPAFYSVKDMLKNGPKLDACSITSAGVENGGDHYVPTMEVLAAGIPTLGEKPISNNIEHAREMVALAKKKRVPYAVDLNHRFTPAARLAKQWIADERLGQLPEGAETSAQLVEVLGRREPPVPEQVGDLLERRVLGELPDVVAPVDEAALLAVDEADLRLEGDDVLQAPLDRLLGHRFDSVRDGGQDGGA